MLPQPTIPSQTAPGLGLALCRLPRLPFFSSCSFSHSNIEINMRIGMWMVWGCGVRIKMFQGQGQFEWRMRCRSNHPAFIVNLLTPCATFCCCWGSENFTKCVKLLRKFSENPGNFPTLMSTPTTEWASMLICQWGSAFYKTAWTFFKLWFLFLKNKKRTAACLG